MEILGSSCILGGDRNFCSAEGTVGLLELRLYPFHYTVVVEDVLAWSLPNHRRWLEVFHADCARLLILLELGLGELLPGEHLGDEGQFLLVLLFKHALCGNWIMNSVHNQVCVIDSIISLSAILAEDTETGATAQTSEAECDQHGEHEDIH